MVQEGKIEEMVGILLEAADSMESISECEIYLVSMDKNEASSVYVYEVWTDESAHQASLGLEVTQKLISRAKPIIKGMERIGTLQIKGGKGISLKN